MIWTQFCPRRKGQSLEVVFTENQFEFKTFTSKIQQQKNKSFGCIITSNKNETFRFKQTQAVAAPSPRLCRKAGRFQQGSVDKLPHRLSIQEHLRFVVPFKITANPRCADKLFLKRWFLLTTIVNKAPVLVLLFNILAWFTAEILAEFLGLS